MRKIETEMRAALLEGRVWHKGNTRVSVELTDEAKGYKKIAVYLHGNCIAAFDWFPCGFRTNIKFSCAGWHTTTTASRLRAAGCSCHISHGHIISEATGREMSSVLS